MMIAAACLMIVSFAGAGEEEIDTCLAELHEIKADITLLNLINGIHFTEEQIEAILKEAKKLEKDLEGAMDWEHRGARELDEEIKVLKEARDSLVKNGKVSEGVKTRHDGLRKNKRNGKGGWKMTPKLMEKAEACAAEIEKKLTAAQKEILMSYKPCMLPTKDLSDPVRVGQASSTAPMERFLEMIRHMSKSHFEKRRESLVESTVTLMERRTGALPEKDRNALTEKTGELFDLVRKMSDVEFALNRADVAAEIEPEDQEKALQRSLADMGVMKYEVRGKIIQFFLVPRATDLLGMRLKQMRAL